LWEIDLNKDKLILIVKLKISSNLLIGFFVIH